MGSSLAPDILQRVIVAVGLSGAFWLQGCGGVAGVSEETGGAGGSLPTDAAVGEAGTSGAAGTANCDCGPLEQCWNGRLCVAKLVPIEGGYAIDATEVAQSQYAAWLATSPNTTTQISECTWNDQFAPETDVATWRCDQLVWPPESKGQHPVVCVDWCDAYAYCKAVGKRLCGRIGGGSFKFEFEPLTDHDQSQWVHACSSGGMYQFPYGWTYEPQTCNGLDKGVLATMAVGTSTGCESSVPGYTGVFDLSGNVWEWDDACDENTGESRSCRIRGGSFYDPVATVECSYDTSSGLGNHQITIGFRCCSDP